MSTVFEIIHFVLNFLRTPKSQIVSCRIFIKFTFPNQKMSFIDLYCPIKHKITEVIDLLLIFGKRSYIGKMPGVQTVIEKFPYVTLIVLIY